MRAALLLLVLILALPSRAPALTRAEEADQLLYALGWGSNYDAGSLKVCLYPNSVILLNGVRQPTDDDDASIKLQPGDVVLDATPEIWRDAGWPRDVLAGDIYQYRLEVLDPRRAVFRLTTFDAIVKQIGPSSREYSRGRERVSRRFELDLTQVHYLLVDFGQNHVQMGDPARTLRSK